MSIRLGAFLKLTDVPQSGGHAKILIQDGEVSVDGAVETRRGRQLHGGEQVEVAGARFRVGPDGRPVTPGDRAVDG